MYSGHLYAHVFMIVEVLKQRDLAKGSLGELDFLENAGYHLDR
jgi:hypothetical protein